VKHTSGARDSVKEFADLSQPKKSGDIRSYEEVDGKWVLPKRKGPEKPKEDSQEDSQQKAVNGGISSEKVIEQQFTSLRQPISKSAEVPWKAEVDEYYGLTTTQAKGSKTPLSGGQLPSQIEAFLRETGNIGTVKTIKFKDAVGRGFIFPWELTSTWKVGV